MQPVLLGREELETSHLPGLWEPCRVAIGLRRLLLVQGASNMPHRQPDTEFRHNAEVTYAIGLS